MSSIFATKNTPAKEVSAIVSGVQDGSLVEPDGTLKVADIKEVAPSIGYSRFYLIAKRAWIEQHEKSRIVKVTKTEIGKAEKKFSNMAAKDVYLRHVLGPKVVSLRNEGISWGDIACYLTDHDGTAIPEAKVRKANDATSEAKAKGQRIGKGGRFAYGDGTLYTEHRQAEGAQVPVDLKGRPTVGDLLNAEGQHTVQVKSA